METKVIYYDDEHNDEFSTAKIKPRTIDERYSYKGGILRKIARVFIYWIIAKPLAYGFLKIKYGHRIVNKKVLKAAKGKGYYLYGNHTNAAADPLVPNMLGFCKSMYVVVHPANVSMPVFGHITPCLGAVPLAGNMKAMKNFDGFIGRCIEKKKAVTVYPEAHIWPYCTWIREFPKTSFGYPVKYEAPVFCFTNTYQKRRFFKTPRMVTYVDGPFFADEELTNGEKKQQLRDIVYNTMCERSRENTAELVRYIKRER